MEAKLASTKPTFSVVGPVYDEVETLRHFYDRMQAAMDAIGEPWELILVDDGSTDGSSDVIRDLAFEDIRVRPVLFSRNFGHQIAVTAGMDYSRGQAVVIIDTDLQDPPELISELAEKWHEGYEVVYAVRTEREGEGWFKRATAAIFYRVINRITEVDIPLDAGLAQTDSTQQAGIARDHHVGHAEAVSDLARVLRPRAAERHQRELGGVVAVAHGDAPDRFRHALVRNAKEALQQVVQ